MIGSVLVIALVIAVALVVGYGMNYFWLRSATGRPESRNTPACGNCGYPSRGVSTFECPECGADLREVGIRAPKQGAADLPYGCALPLLWTVGIFVFTSLVVNKLPAVVPQMQSYEYTTGLTPISNALPPITLSAEYVMKTQGQGGGAGSSVRSTSHEIDLGPNRYGGSLHHAVFELRASASRGNAIRFEIDALAPHFAYQTSGGQSVSHAAWVSAQDFEAWLVGNGLSATDPATAVIANDLFLLVQAMASNRDFVTLNHLQSSGFQFRWGHIKNNWWELVTLVVCFALWMGGLRWCIRRPNKNRVKI